MKPRHKVYISYAREDRARLKEVYQKLSDSGFVPRTSELGIIPGEEWLSRMQAELKDADVVLAALSHATSKPSEQMKMELNQALLESNKTLPNRIVVIPVRLEECEVPRILSELPCVDLFKDNGLSILIQTIRHASTRVPELEKPSPDLVHAAAVGKCVLYAGAGLSAPAGYPTWDPFVNRLLAWAHEKACIDPELLEGLQDSIKRGELDFVADSVVASLTSDDSEGKDLHEFFKREYLGNIPAIPKRNELLKKVGFSGALSTDFDNLLERTFEVSKANTHQDTEELLVDLAKRKFFVTKLYGEIEQPKTLLVSPAQYEDAIIGNKDFAKFMEVLFVSKTILFLGASLDGILAYLEGIRFQSSRQHYALVAVIGTAWRAKADLLKRRFNISVIPFKQSDDCPEVTDFLERLVDLTHAESKRIKTLSIAGAHSRSRLRSIELTNIGPFNHLKLDFDDSWTILLGDNGTGKTFVLRSIALAMLGQEAQPYANFLLRSGEPSGRIVLKTTDEEYITQIFRRNGNDTEIKSVPGHMLIGEGLLALGFPVLRSISSNPLKSVQLPDVLGRPDVDDLLPLFTSNIDPRINNITQWFLNIDYLIEKKKGRYSELLDKYLEIIGRLLKDMKLEYKGINIKTRQVLVTTDDGVVPIQWISQGAASLIGWIGVLLQRLYDFYDSEEKPADQNAIVLMDEIDAHMHPGWQQTIVSELTELFPNIQFIVTTHSPFVAAGREQRQVIGLKRDKNRAIQVVHPKFALKGLGVAGILTSDMFNLRTTIDRTTMVLINRRAELFAKGESRNPKETEEMQELFAQLARLGFNREYSDPFYAKYLESYFEHLPKREVLTDEERHRANVMASRALHQVLEETS